MEQEFLCQAFCPQLAITWVNFHASEVNAAVLSRLYRCEITVEPGNSSRRGFSLVQSLNYSEFRFSQISEFT